MDDSNLLSSMDSDSGSDLDTCQLYDVDPMIFRFSGKRTELADKDL